MGIIRVGEFGKPQLVLVHPQTLHNSCKHSTDTHTHTYCPFKPTTGPSPLPHRVGQSRSSYSHCLTTPHTAPSATHWSHQQHNVSVVVHTHKTLFPSHLVAYKCNMPSEAIA